MDKVLLAWIWIGALSHIWTKGLAWHRKRKKEYCLVAKRLYLVRSGINVWRQCSKGNEFLLYLMSLTFSILEM